MNNYFKTTDTLYDIINKYPETLDIFISKGFSQMEDKEKREKFGKMVKLKDALKMKEIDIESFVELLEDIIVQNRESVEVSESKKGEQGKDALKIQGLLPCPVRLPMLEALEGFLDENEDIKSKVTYDLKAASMGLDWLKEDVLSDDTGDSLADIFISAGFDLFFDNELMGKFKEKDLFKDYTEFDKLNTDFDNEEIDLKDPKKDYSMIGVVPAVFLVNKNELGDREMPKTWEDILKPEFKNSVSLPIGDFDLFNAILLNIYKMYGEEAVMKLGESLVQNLHPSQMVKSHTKTKPPVITIMPYFFTKTVKEGGPMAFVWPEDGAIISPIFMLSKKNKKPGLKETVDFFASKKVGEILAHKGLFPSIHPDVDNRIPKEDKYMWVGWDYIYDNEIGKLINKCEKLFYKKVNID
ncbi:MAG: ABC transporter substrate-binding protein [Fusobacteriota bacterium]